MSEKFQFNEYCRTNLGEIFKIVRINELNRNIVYDKQGAKYYRDDIAKHSKNITDLIGVGDIVYTYDVLNYDVIYIYDNEMLQAVKQDIEQGIKIKTIWTKEQLKSIEYNVGGITNE